MMNFLLIDDNPGERPDKISEALKEIAPVSKLDTITINTEEMIKPALKDRDFIILDWCFPEPGPQGEHTLRLIRSLGFKGPILIYTVGFERFDEHIGPEKADGYYWESWGIDSLTHTIERLIKQKSKGSPQRPKVPIYYPDEKSMSHHFYHPMTTTSASPSTKEEAKKLVFLASTEWDCEDGRIKASGVMGRVIEKIEKLAEIDISVLILGDTGTGKELVAKLLHHHHKNKGIRHTLPGHSKDDDFYMALNCGAFRELLDLELFGSLPGSFTGGINKAGIFEQVTVHDDKGKALHGGTVFLDEIGEMLPPSQSFLLRVLQEKYVYRMGHDEKKTQGKDKDVLIKQTGEKIPKWLFGKIPVKFRLVAATNKNLMTMVTTGDFRLDLFHRIGRVVINLPPLVSRSIEDFNLLFQYFLLRYSEEYKRKIPLSHNDKVLESPSRDVIESLYKTYPWRGNVRELEGLVSSMVAMSDANRSEPLSLKDLPESLW